MKKIRYALIALWLLSCLATSATAQVNIGIGLPNVSIGINLPLFPEFARVPGYPVYYAPRVDANYFFYDGMYWVYLDDNWYASDWYNGPWWLVDPYTVPLYILRIPVRYYRLPPPYFREWRANAPPRWGQHWGHDWEQRRSGWDKWRRSSAPKPAPLPLYQRQYAGEKYPQVQQQRTLRNQHYRYQPRDTTVRKHFQPQVERKESAPAQRGRQAEPRLTTPGQQQAPHSPPSQQRVPAATRPAPHQAPPRQQAPAVHEQRQQPGAVQREQPPRAREQEQRAPERRAPQGPERDRGQGQKQDERGR